MLFNVYLLAIDSTQRKCDWTNRHTRSAFSFEIPRSKTDALQFAERTLWFSSASVFYCRSERVHFAWVVRMAQSSSLLKMYANTHTQWIVFNYKKNVMWADYGWNGIKTTHRVCHRWHTHRRQQCSKKSDKKLVPLVDLYFKRIYLK